MHKRTKLLDISKAVKDKVWERDGHRCILCESIFAMPNAHYISRAQGGLGIPENVVTLCYVCHDQYDNGADGNFSLFGCCTGFYQCLLHEIFVVEWIDHLLISFSLKRVG